jgi:hypothetical protein
VSFARIIVFALALTHVVGLADLVVEDGCEEVCNDDGCGTDCLPGLACRCHCPSAVPLLGASVVTSARLDSDKTQGPIEAVQRMHANPDPLEILHVPKHVV